MQIQDWFDVENIDHLKAWRHLENTGSWPKDFVPGNVECGTNWQIAIIAKLANEYIERQLWKEHD